MKTLAPTLLNLFVFSTLTLSAVGNANASSTAVCGRFYKISLPLLPKTKIERHRLDTWNLELELSKEGSEIVDGILKKIKIPGRWEQMVQNNPRVDYRYQEKTFERTSLNGEKYVVSYHVIEPQDGNYKTTIVLQHGFAESATYFRAATKILVAMGYRVIAMDGANSGNTLLRTMQTRKPKLFEYPYLKAPSPVEDGLALADVLRMEIPGREKFILLGHSRGFAVTSLALSTGAFDDQLIDHIAANGYDVWKVDSFLEKQISNPFRFIPGVGFFSEFFYGQIRGMFRKSTNSIAGQVMYSKIAEHQSHKPVEAIGEELANHDRVTIEFLTSATMQIADGLAGKNRSQNGFSTLGLYDKSRPFFLDDNGFGLTDTKGSYTLSHISDAVKAKTRLVFSESDHLITPEDSAPLIAAMPTPPVTITRDNETGVAATHFLPSERPFDIIEIILKSHKNSKSQK